MHFGLKEIPYLGYVITRDGIKPDLKKVQEIMDLGLTTTTTEDRAVIGMVQYYRYMWPKRYHILDPMKEADSGLNGKKDYFGMTH